MSHAINSHVLTSTNPCINMPIHVVNTRLCVFMYKHSGAITKSDVIISNLHSRKHNFVTSKWSYQCIGTGKKDFTKHFLQCFWVTKFLCNNNDQTWFFDAFTSGSDFNISLGAQQMLIQRKSCLIPILMIITMDKIVLHICFGAETRIFFMVTEICEKGFVNDSTY